jgi:hypothetical protein
MTDPRAETGVFHGWKLVGALSVILFFGVGGSMYAGAGRQGPELERTEVLRLGGHSEME